MNNIRLNPGLLFNTAGNEDLAGKSVRGGIITMGSTGVMFAINMVRTVVLARLLTPADFGIIGMVTVFINFVAMFKDAGLSAATVQKSEVTHDQISTLSWLNLLISGGLSLLIIAGAPLVSLFYNKPELTWITISLAISFMLGGTTIQHRALLRRHMKFDSLALVTILSTIGGVAITVVMALLGWNYWALVVGSIATTTLEVMFTFFFCPWIPGKMVKGSGVGSMLKFGLHITASSFANYFSRNSDNILIGKFIGAAELGLYSKAYQIFMLPIQNIRNPINQIAIPALSSLQKDPERYRNYFHRITDILATISFPVATYLYFEAGFIVNLMLGSQWMGAVPVFKLLAFGGLIQAVASQRGLVMMTMGHSQRFLNWSIFYAIMAVSSFAIGIPFGIEGVAGAYAIAEYLVFIPSLFYCYRNSPINPLYFVKKLAAPLLVSLLSASGMETVKYFWNGDSLWHHIIYLGAFGLIFVTLSWFRKDFRETAGVFVKEIIKKRKK